MYVKTGLTTYKLYKGPNHFFEILQLYHSSVVGPLCWCAISSILCTSR